MNGEPGAGTRRPTAMRPRVVALAAVAAFAVAVTGLAVVAARSGDDSGLERLPFAAAGSGAAEARDAMTLAAPAGPVEYVVEGDLPDLPDEAPAFRLGSDGTEQAAGRVARALGVDAEKVTVEPVPGLPWYLSKALPDIAVSRGTATIQACPPCPPDADCAACAPTPIDAVPAPEPAVDLPSRGDAERIARDIFGKLGVRTEGLELLGGQYTWDAVVSPSVDGLPTRGLEHGLSIGAKGAVVGAHGYLGTPDRIGDYPLIDVGAGLDRLRTGVGVGPQPLVDRAVGAPEIDIAPRVVTVTGARLALLHVGDLLGPVYEVLTKEGGALTAPAVTDRWLEQQQQQRPVRPDGPEPAPPLSRIDPGSGSGVCSGSGSAGGDPEENQPLTVGICAEPTTAKVGEEVRFMVTVTDPDAEIQEGSCGGPRVLFGDEDDEVVHADCSPACAAPVPAGKPGKLERTYRHRYEKPGTYTATFHFQSGPCTKGSSRGEGSVTITVVE